MQQITVGGVDLDQVETRCQGALGRPLEFFNDGVDLALDHDLGNRITIGERNGTGSDDGPGAFLGWELALLTLILASLTGSIVGVGVLVAKHESLKYALPFGTFLAAGALVAAVAGDALLNWYLGLY